MIGITADWTCCRCGRKTRTFQIVTPGMLGGMKLRPPRGWRVRFGRTYCGSGGGPLAKKKTWLEQMDELDALAA